MATCTRCGGIFFKGGVTIGTRKFCSDECARKGRAIAVADTLPAAEVHFLTKDVFNGACPVCGRTGNAIDVRYHHRLTTLWLYFARYENRSTERFVSCRACAAKRQLVSLGYTSLLGWWSPRGLFLTPAWMGRNLYELAKLAKKAPSTELRACVAIEQAKNLIADQERTSSAASSVD